MIKIMNADWDGVLQKWVVRFTNGGGEVQEAVGHKLDCVKKLIVRLTSSYEIIKVAEEPAQPVFVASKPALYLV